MFRLAILLCIFCLVCSSPPALCQPWVASFLTADSRALVRQFFDGSGSRFPIDNSTTQLECNHMTIEFNPQPSPNKYAEYFGLPQQIELLGYAHDEHGQAVLAYINTTTAKEYVLSVNAYPHVTDSDSAVDPYGAVYSNDLWNRFEAAGVIHTLRDEFGKPFDFSITQAADAENADEWQGSLPAFNSTTSSAQYAATEGYVRKFSGELPLLESVVCVNTAWDQDTDTCLTVAVLTLGKGAAQFIH